MTQLPGYYSPDESDCLTDYEIEAICDSCEAFMADWRKKCIAGAIASVKEGADIKDACEDATDNLHSWPSNEAPNNIGWWLEYHGDGVGVMKDITAEELEAL